MSVRVVVGLSSFLRCAREPCDLQDTASTRPSIRLYGDGGSTRVSMRSDVRGLSSTQGEIVKQMDDGSTCFGPNDLSEL
jgi:hypothetical protein